MAEEYQPPNEIKIDQQVTTVHDGGVVIGVQKLGPSMQEIKEVVDSAIQTLEQGQHPTTWDGRYPYLGLDAYQESDAEFFFGRETVVNELLDRIQKSNFITVSGPSGSGKSSVVRAGLIHRLRQNRLPNSGDWIIATMVPGNDPLEHLAESIDYATDSYSHGDRIREVPSDLPRVIDRCLKQDPRRRFVLFIDQFEEIFTQVDESLQTDRFNNRGYAGPKQSVNRDYLTPLGLYFTLHRDSPTA